MRKDPLISIGAVADRTGAAVSAIRYYTDEGLVPTVRSASGHRLFHRSSIRRISFILIAQGLGYTLAEIGDKLATLPQARTPTKADWTRLSKRFNQDIDLKIAQLQKMQETLSGCIGCGCLSLKSCQLYNPQDKIRHRGNGARYLLGNSFKDL